MSTIDPITATTPSRGQDESSFNANSELYLAQLKAFSAQLAANIAAIIDAANQAVAAAASAAAAAASATTAVNAPGTQATTTTSITPGAGDISVPLAQTGKAFAAGMWVIAASAAAPTSKYILGQIKTFTSGTGAMTVTVPTGGYAGTAFSDGVVSLTAVPPLTVTTSAFTLAQQLIFGNPISPAALSGDVNNWAPTGLTAANVVRIDGGGGDRLITGVVAGSGGELKALWNVGSVNLYLVHQSASSTAANRFYISGGSFKRLGAGEAIFIQYDGASNRWVVLGPGTAQAGDLWTGTDFGAVPSAGDLKNAAAFGALIDASTIAWDISSKGLNAAVTPGAAGRTMGALTNLWDGAPICLKIIASTGNTITSWNSQWDFGLAGLPSLSTTTGQVDYVFGIYDAARGKIRAALNRSA